MTLLLAVNNSVILDTIAGLSKNKKLITFMYKNSLKYYVYYTVGLFRLKTFGF